MNVINLMQDLPKKKKRKERKGKIKQQEFQKRTSLYLLQTLRNNEKLL